MQNNQKEIILLEDLGMLFATQESKKPRRFGLFQCFCGNKFKARIHHVYCGNTQSCGCFKIQKATTHGFKSHRLYSVWNSMMYRCNNPKYENYKDYGGRGISVCKEWHDVKNFIDDMYPTFQEGLTIDRKNNELGYSKENCRWTTQNIQTRNTRLIRKNNTTGYKGVFYNNNCKRYTSRIGIDKKYKSLGYFKTPLDAAKAYDQYVIDNNLEHTLNGVLT